MADGRFFIVLLVQYGGRDVMWAPPIVSRGNFFLAVLLLHAVYDSNEADLSKFLSILFQYAEYLSRRATFDFDQVWRVYIHCSFIVLYFLSISG